MTDLTECDTYFVVARPLAEELRVSRFRKYVPIYTSESVDLYQGTEGTASYIPEFCVNWEEGLNFQTYQQLLLSDVPSAWLCRRGCMNQYRLKQYFWHIRAGLGKQSHILTQLDTGPGSKEALTSRLGGCMDFTSSVDFSSCRHYGKRVY